MLCRCDFPKMRFVAFTPTLRPIGGVGKIVDYCVHASRMGFSPLIVDMSGDVSANLLLSKPYSASWLSKGNVISYKDYIPNYGDVIFVSLPQHLTEILESYEKSELKNCTIIQIIQNIRHCNPFWLEGSAFANLSQNIIRISINETITQELEKWVPEKEQLFEIPHGHDHQFFESERKVINTQSIAFNNFKGEFGEQVVKACSKLGLKNLTFHKIKKGVSWLDLKSSLSNSTIFISTPDRNEGLYLPGLEAMSASCIVLTPDVGANRFYCEFGVNSIEYQFQNAWDCARKIALIQDLPNTTLESFTRSARHKADSLGLEREFNEFKKFCRAALFNS